MTILFVVLLKLKNYFYVKKHIIVKPIDFSLCEEYKIY